jgi:hypothetical protein
MAAWLCNPQSIIAATIQRKNVFIGLVFFMINLKVLWEIKVCRERIVCTTRKGSFQIE